MFIRLYATSESCFDDGIEHMILSTTIEAIEDYEKNQPWSLHPSQTFEISDDSLLLAMKVKVILIAKEIE